MIKNKKINKYVCVNRRIGKCEGEKLRQTSGPSEWLLTWQRLMCVHVTDGCDKSMQPMAIALCVKLGQNDGMV